MGTAEHAFAAIGKWLHREFVAAWPVFLFFSIGFLLLLTIVKLVLANFSIEVPALSKAVIGALFAAKAVLILDETPLARRHGCGGTVQGRPNPCCSHHRLGLCPQVTDC